MVLNANSTRRPFKYFMCVIKEANLSIPFFMSIDLFSPHANLNLELRADCVVDLILVCAAKYFSGVSCVQPSSGKHGEEATLRYRVPGPGWCRPAHLSFTFPATRCVIIIKGIVGTENYDCFIKMRIIDGHLKIKRKHCVTKHFAQQSSLTCLEASLLPQTAPALG